jgi:hypothetical protein
MAEKAGVVPDDGMVSQPPSILKFISLGRVNTTRVVLPR